MKLVYAIRYGTNETAHDMFPFQLNINTRDIGDVQQFANDVFAARMGSETLNNGKIDKMIISFYSWDNAGYLNLEDRFEKRVPVKQVKTINA